MTLEFDSILIAVDSNAINTSEFYKMGEHARDIGVPMAERAYATGCDDVIVGGMIAMAVVLVCIVYKSHRLLVHHIKDFFSIKSHNSSNVIKDTSSEVGNVLMLATVSALSLSLVYFNDLNDEYHFNTALGVPYWVMGMGFVAIMGFIYLKAWIYSIVNWVFFDSESRRNWIARYFFLTSLTAFVLYPISLIDVVAPFDVDIATWGVILTWIIYEILLFYRLSTNFISKNHAYVPFLMYFCSVELVPALILWNGLTWASDSIIVKNILY